MRAINPIILAAATLASCQQPAATKVDQAWVRLAAAPGRPAGGYFTLTGGATDRTLIGVTSTAAGRIELHETMAMSGGHASHGAMTMRPVGQVAVPAGGTIVFAPGGKHLMLYDVKPGVKSGTTLPLEFRFADGRALTVAAQVITAGDPPPRP